MKVAFLNRNPNLWLGGDVFYITNTIKELKKLKHEVDYIYKKESLDKYDIVHLVHCTQDWAYENYLHAKAHKKKLVLSPIYYPYHPSYQRAKEVWNGVDYIVCSTERERKFVLDEGIDSAKVTVIPRGVSIDFYERSRPCLNYVLGVGRWEGNKHQDHVISACKNLGIKYVGVGPVYNKAYFNSSVVPLKYGKILTKPVFGKELVAYYSEAKVVVVASMWEEFGFPVLEGGLNGCNLVVSDRVGAREYFDDIEVFEYANVKKLEESITREFKAKRDHKEYSKYIKDNFLWPIVTKKLEKIYEVVLNG